MSKIRAERNEAICSFLHDNGRWPDWVVTTAFYSALHYVRSRLFPLSLGDQVYRNFEEYCALNSHFRQDKHQLLLTLVFQHLRPAYESYRFLMNESKKARYNDYDTPRNIASKAVECLSTVKELC